MAPLRRAAAALLAILLVGTALAEGEVPEYAIKAAFLYKFAAYVDWPAAAFESPSSALKLCIVGTDPFGDVLDKAVDGKHIGDRPILLQRLKVASRNAGCQIAYIGGSDAQSVAEALVVLRGAAVLTVTDSAHGDVTGIVHFVLKDNRVRFDIDDAAATANGLTISSKLLELALSITPKK